MWLWGWHVFKSVIKYKKRKIYKIVTLERFKNIVIEELNGLKIDVKFVDRQYMDFNYGNNHQGIAIEVDQIKIYSLKEWIHEQDDKGKVVLVACDLLEDAHNLGAIIRTARALGANGILVTKKRSVPLNGVVAKAAAGAMEILPIIQVSNLSCSLFDLKKNGYRIYGLDHNGRSEYIVFKKSVLVLGQEGNGLRELTRKRCDDIVSIHTKQDFSVLNVSVAAGIILHEFCVKN